MTAKQFSDPEFSGQNTHFASPNHVIRVLQARKTRAPEVCATVGYKTLHNGATTLSAASESTASII
jgi:hypothetical protein